MCIVGGIASMIYATSYGFTLLGYVDAYINQILILFCIVLECVLFAWIYNAEKLVVFLNSRSKSLKISRGWLLTVKYILPIFILVIWFGGMLTVVSSYSFWELLATFFIAILIFAICLVLTLKKPTNPKWVE